MQNLQCTMQIQRGEQVVICGEPIWFPSVVSMNDRVWTVPLCLRCRRTIEGLMDRLVTPAWSYVKLHPDDEVEVLTSAVPSP